MDIDATDILLDSNYDLDVAHGDFVIGKSLWQDVELVLMLNQGELKSDPILGPSLVRLMNTNISESEIKARIKLHLMRDGKDYDALKELIRLRT